MNFFTKRIMVFHASRAFLPLTSSCFLKLGFTSISSSSTKSFAKVILLHFHKFAFEFITCSCSFSVRRIFLILHFRNRRWHQKITRLGGTRLTRRKYSTAPVSLTPWSTSVLLFLVLYFSFL